MLLLLLALASASPFHLHEKGRDLDFRYDWPGEASSIPSLASRLRAELKADRTESARDARVDSQAARKGRYEFMPHEFSRELTFDGQSIRLASFTDKGSRFTGGAHPNFGFTELLWDKAKGRQVAFNNLFARPVSPLIRTPYCQQLAAERRKKTGSSKPGSLWEACPDPLDQAVVARDANRNGRSERLVIIASPYAVGSYAEGAYVVMLPVTATLIAALKPEYRASFEAQRQ
jgi:hypothetical protein